MISRPQLILDFWYCSPTLRRHRLPLNDTAKEAVDLHHRKRIKVAVSTQFACNALALCLVGGLDQRRSEEPTSELQSLMRISYAVFCLSKTKTPIQDSKTPASG